MDGGAPVGDPTGVDTLTAMRAWVAALEAEQDQAKKSALGVVSATG